MGWLITPGYQRTFKETCSYMCIVNEGHTSQNTRQGLYKEKKKYD